LGEESGIDVGLCFSLAEILLRGEPIYLSSRALKSSACYNASSVFEVSSAMQEIEVMGSIDDQGQLLLLEPLNLAKHAKVRVRLTLLNDDTEPEFDPETDSKAQILADLKESLRQADAGKTFPIAELWDGIDA
jgi:hypothetical protein